MTTSDPKTLQLDGHSGYGALASAQALGLYDGDFTVEAWVRIDAWGTTDYLPILGTAATAAQQGLHLAVWNQRPYLGFYEADTEGQSELALATWYHLAWRFTRATGEQTIFLNGVPDGSSTGNGAFLGTETVWIGRYADGHFFRGEIAELRIWRTTRTAAEILDHMHRRLAGDEPDLVGVWPLDDGEGESAANRKTRHPGRAPYGLEGRPLSVFEGQSEEQAVELDGDGTWIEIPHAADLHFVDPD
ncbi:MAG: LamG domain-containing protein, partial [bacterium]|nr:LamG domain-containing protein [bacterium]